MMKKFRGNTSLILVFMVLITLVGCNPKVVEDTRPVAKGFIWEATSTEGEVIALVGTMHPAPSTHILLNNKLKEILNNAEVLTVEADVTTADNIVKSQKSTVLEAGDKVGNYLSTDEIAQLNQILSKYKRIIEKNDNLNAYGITMIIQNYILSEIGFTGKSTDLLLINEAKNNNIEVDELETMDFQTELLNRIYNWESLKDSLEGIETYNDSINREKELAKELFDNYVNGDIESAEKLEAKYREEADEEIYNLLSIERNKGMADKIDELIKDGKKRVVAVGYRHYIGEDSVLDLLEERGYIVKTIE